MSDLLLHSPSEFAGFLAGIGTQRAYLVRDPSSSELRASHPELARLTEWLKQNRRDYAEHEAIFIEVAKDTGALMGAFLHKTIRGQGQGGLRQWPYDTLQDFLGDGLRLSQGMGRKNALAGLWWGGGKGIIVRPAGLPVSGHDRNALYQAYGRFISSLAGLYVTAEDVGTRPEDVAEVFKETRFVTCIPPKNGGSGNPSFATAKGVVCAMAAALGQLGLGSIAGKRVAMQGVGHVGGAMIDELLQLGVGEIVVADVDEERVRATEAKYRNAPVTLRVVPRGDDSILAEPCDVLAPNALGGVLNEKTINTLRCKLVCGAANNQLLDEIRDAAHLTRRNIPYVPDFVANRMGIVNCANEQYGHLNHDPAILRHFDASYEHSVHQTTVRVLARAAETGETPTQAATRIADGLALEPHPLWGHRSRAILQELLEGGWEKGSS